MNKQIFLDGLRTAISSLPPEEVNKTLAYYAEIIDDRIEDGMSEQQAIASLEPVQVLAGRILAEYGKNPAAQPPAQQQYSGRQKSGASTALIVVLAILLCPIWMPLAAALLGLAIGLICLLCGIIVLISAAVVGLAVAGVAILIYAFANPGIWGMPLTFSLGLAFICVGIGILLIFPAIALVKLIWRGIESLCGKIHSWLTRKKGGRKNE